MKCQTCFNNEAVYGGECDDCLKVLEHRTEGMIDRFGENISLVLALLFGSFAILAIYAAFNV
jgi:hypothetical protein